MKIAIALVLSLSSVVASAATRFYGADVLDASWELSRDKDVCRLSHHIPQFGNAVFLIDRDGVLTFELYGMHSVAPKARARIRSTPPQWMRGSSEQRLGRVNVPAGAAPLRLSEASARRLLLELEKGMFPTFEYEDRADLKEQVEVALSAVNFRSGYNRFTACSRALGEKMTKAAPKAAAKPVNDAVALTPEPAAAVVETRPLQPDSGAHAPIMTGEPLPPGVGAPPAMPATLHKAGMPAAPRDTPGVETRAPAVDTALLGPDHLAVEGPAAAEPAPAHLADKPWEQGVVLFEPGSTELSRQARDHLDLLATLINQGVETGMVRINGHADAVGSPRDNAQLSHLRADTVRDYLVQQGVEPTRLLVEHFGEARPAAPNDDATRRAENRRVNLYLVR